MLTPLVTSQVPNQPVEFSFLLSSCSVIRVKRIGRYDYISIFNCSATTMMVVSFFATN